MRNARIPKLKLIPFLWGSLAIVILFVVLYVVLGKLYRWATSTREGMTGCSIKKCSADSGCVAPTGIDGNCDEEVYQDKNGDQFKKCYYECPDYKAPCAYDRCCKVVCPPVYFKYQSSSPVHPSMIIHTDDVIIAGVPAKSGSSDEPAPSNASENNGQTSHPQSIFEPTTGSASSSSVPASSVSKSVSKHTNHQGGDPMPEYAPNQQHPATEPAKFPSRTEREARERNQAFMNGDMSQVDRQHDNTVTYQYQADSGMHVNVMYPDSGDGPIGYTDPLIL